VGSQVFVYGTRRIPEHLCAMPDDIIAITYSGVLTLHAVRLYTVNQQQWPSVTGDGNTLEFCIPFHLTFIFVGESHITFETVVLQTFKFQNKQSSDAVLINYCMCTDHLRTQNMCNSLTNDSNHPILSVKTSATIRYLTLRV